MSEEGKAEAGEVLAAGPITFERDSSNGRFRYKLVRCLLGNIAHEKMLPSACSGKDVTPDDMLAAGFTPASSLAALQEEVNLFRNSLAPHWEATETTLREALAAAESKLTELHDLLNRTLTEARTTATLGGLPERVRDLAVAALDDLPYIRGKLTEQIQANEALMAANRSLAAIRDRQGAQLNEMGRVISERDALIEANRSLAAARDFAIGTANAATAKRGHLEEAARLLRESLDPAFDGSVETRRMALEQQNRAARDQTVAPTPLSEGCPFEDCDQQVEVRYCKGHHDQELRIAAESAKRALTAERAKREHLGTELHRALINGSALANKWLAPDSAEWSQSDQDDLDSVAHQVRADLEAYRDQSAAPAPPPAGAEGGTTEVTRRLWKLFDAVCNWLTHEGGPEEEVARTRLREDFWKHHPKRVGMPSLLSPPRSQSTPTVERQASPAVTLLRSWSDDYRSKAGEPVDSIASKYYLSTRLANVLSDAADAVERLGGAESAKATEGDRVQVEALRMTLGEVTAVLSERNAKLAAIAAILAGDK